MNREEFERLGSLKEKMGLSERRLHPHSPNYLQQETFLGSLGSVYDLYWGVESGHPMVGRYTSNGNYCFLYTPEHFVRGAAETFKSYSRSYGWYAPALKMAKRKGLYTGIFV
jgi:hypothetical protein